MWWKCYRIENHITPILLSQYTNKVQTHTQSESVFRQPTGYKCKPVIWSIYNSCVFDLVICINLIRILMWLNQWKKKKQTEKVVFPFADFCFSENWKKNFKSGAKEFCRKSMLGGGGFIFLFQCLIDFGSWILQRLLSSPTSGSSASSNTFNKGKHFHWSTSLQSI